MQIQIDNRFNELLKEVSGLCARQAVPHRWEKFNVDLNNDETVAGIAASCVLATELLHTGAGSFQGMTKMMADRDFKAGVVSAACFMGFVHNAIYDGKIDVNKLLYAVEDYLRKYVIEGNEEEIKEQVGKEPEEAVKYGVANVIGALVIDNINRLDEDPDTDENAFELTARHAMFRVLGSAFDSVEQTRKKINSTRGSIEGSLNEVLDSMLQGSVERGSDGRDLN